MRCCVVLLFISIICTSTFGAPGVQITKITEYGRLCPPNEIYDCGSACQTTCATLGKPCPIINVRCNNGCYCIPGYARDWYGICIPEEKCPPPIDECEVPELVCKGLYEVYTDCGNPCDSICSKLGDVCTKQCIKGCFCKEGFAKDKDGLCIPKKLCSLFG